MESKPDLIIGRKLEKNIWQKRNHTHSDAGTHPHDICLISAAAFSGFATIEFKPELIMKITCKDFYGQQASNQCNRTKTDTTNHPHGDNSIRTTPFVDPWITQRHVGSPVMGACL